ncbi:tail fiber protein [Paenibacillus lautus]|uniref:tail fiber protein n=1 Tax=Paenibacillus lautus TaxID=1401 RepID=UPI003D268D57
MSSFGAKGLTNKGRVLQAKAQAGVQLKYTKYVLGDAQLGGQSIATLTGVISPKKTVDVTRLKMTPPNQATVGFVLSNQDVTTGFYFRELGLYAMDPDEGEILYWYANAGDTADYIPPTNTGDVISKTIDMLVYVGTASNVTLTIDQNLAYVTHDELEEALEGLDPDIPDASLTQKGIVQLSNATNGTRENVAPTEKALKAAYDRGSAGVTAAAAAQAKADAAETPAGAQAKANAAENNAKGYIDAKPWQKRKLTEENGLSINVSNGNANNLVAAGFYVGENIANAPISGAGQWYYINVIAMASGVWVKQEAINLFTNTYQMRTGSDAGGGAISWGPWTQDLFTSVANGKNDIAAAIRDKGQNAQGSDSFQQLANAIRQISTGSASLVSTSFTDVPLTSVFTHDLLTIPGGRNAASIFSVDAPNQSDRYQHTIHLHLVSEGNQYIGPDKYVEAGLYLVDSSGQKMLLDADRKEGGGNWVSFANLLTLTALQFDRASRQIVFRRTGGGNDGVKMVTLPSNFRTQDPIKLIAQFSINYQPTAAIRCSGAVNKAYVIGF